MKFGGLQNAWCYPSDSEYEQIGCSKKGKGKAIPLQALIGPEGARRLRLPVFEKSIQLITRQNYIYLEPRSAKNACNTTHAIYV
jgi:hypothetical protein